MNRVPGNDNNMPPLRFGSVNPRGRGVSSRSNTKNTTGSSLSPSRPTTTVSARSQQSHVLRSGGNPHLSKECVANHLIQKSLMLKEKFIGLKAQNNKMPLSSFFINYSAIENEPDLSTLLLPPGQPTTSDQQILNRIEILEMQMDVSKVISESTYISHPQLDLMDSLQDAYNLTLNQGVGNNEMAEIKQNYQKLITKGGEGVRATHSAETKDPNDFFSLTERGDWYVDGDSLQLGDKQTYYEQYLSTSNQGVGLAPGVNMSLHPSMKAADPDVSKIDEVLKMVVEISESNTPQLMADRHDDLQKYNQTLEGVISRLIMKSRRGDNVQKSLTNGIVAFQLVKGLLSPNDPQLKSDFIGCVEAVTKSSSSAARSTQRRGSDPKLTEVQIKDFLSELDSGLAREIQKVFPDVLGVQSKKRREKKFLGIF